MIENKKKYLWLSDLHLKFIGRYKVLNIILDQNPNAVFLTGDISEGFSFLSDLKFLGAKIGRPLYFIHGNHELWGSSFDILKKNIRELCKKYKNLMWLTDIDNIKLNNNSCLIGAESWYDCRIGNPNYIKYTLDWLFIKDFNKLNSMEERIIKIREIADNYTNIIVSKLEKALSKFDIIYLMGHVPSWKEAHRANTWLSDKFYEPYNINFLLGQKIEEVVKNFENKKVICLFGHVHLSSTIYVNDAIECRVHKGSYKEELLFI